MADYEDITIIGNLGRDPEMRYLPDGTAVTNFSMAVNRKKKDAQEVTHWFRVTVWGKLAEPCNEYLHKSSKVLVAGALIADEQTGGPVVFERKDGSKGAAFEINARTVLFLDRASDNAGEGQSAQHTSKRRPASEDDYGDVPF
jgi:single-strand DNA-binding protein